MHRQTDGQTDGKTLERIDRREQVRLVPHKLSLPPTKLKKLNDTDRQTDRPTDRPSYRAAQWQLKTLTMKSKHRFFQSSPSALILETTVRKLHFMCHKPRFLTQVSRKRTLCKLVKSDSIMLVSNKTYGQLGRFSSCL